MIKRGDDLGRRSNIFQETRRPVESGGVRRYAILEVKMHYILWNIAVVFFKLVYSPNDALFRPH